MHGCYMEAKKATYNDERMSSQASIANFGVSFFLALFFGPQHQTHVCMIKFGWRQQLLKYHRTPLHCMT